jgi:hypothetical protein
MEQKPFVLGAALHEIGGQTHLDVTLATAVALALIIFVGAFLLGLWCGWMWQQRRR